MKVLLQYCSNDASDVNDVRIQLSLHGAASLFPFSPRTLQGPKHVTDARLLRLDRGCLNYQTHLSGRSTVRNTEIRKEGGYDVNNYTDLHCHVVIFLP